MNQRAVRFQTGCETQRHGLAVLIVLLLITITLATSYSVLRMQSVEVTIQNNANLTAMARHAAVSGIYVGFKEMHTPNWTGVGTILSRSLGNHTSFQVSYEVGDPSLVSGHPEHGDSPYRVTLLATGLAVDPADPTRTVSHQIRAVARLIPRALAAEPTHWDDMTSHTLYQSHNDTATVNVPFHVEGPVRFRGNLNLSEDYDWTSGIRGEYFYDLYLSEPFYGKDYRPFNGPLTVSFTEHSDTVQLLKDSMDIPLTMASPISNTAWVHPGAITTYRLYPGGKLYNATLLNNMLWDGNYGPDPDVNPAGLFFRSGQVDLTGNVTIRGSLIVENGAGGNVNVMGQNIQLLPVDLPPLQDTSEPVRLPVAVVSGDFQIHANSSGTIRGLMAVFNEFKINADDQDDINVAMETQLITRKIIVEKRSDWDQPSYWWSDQYMYYCNYYYDWYFWEYLDWSASLGIEPAIEMSPDPTPARYHWHKPDHTIYVPHPDDEGLRWSLLEWTDNP